MKLNTFRKIQRALTFIKRLQGDRLIITFMGFSGTGYELVEDVRKKLADILSRYKPSEVVINAGATEVGIGMVYKVAKLKGFSTLGVVSTQAKKYNAEISPYLDHCIYIQDREWGGVINGEISPTSEVMVSISDKVYAIGGGLVAKDEFMASKKLGKEVHFIPAEMNHERAIDKAHKKGRSKPIDFRGGLEKFLAQEKASF